MSTMFRSEEGRAAVLASYDRFLARVPSPRTRSVATRFGATNVLEAGRSDGPTFVALHGALASSAHVTVELGPLLEHARVVAPDVVGQSVKSEDRRIELDGPAYAEWLTDVLDALSIDRAHLLGVSFGGFVASKVAAHAPERIDRLVLLVPAGFVSGPAWKGFTKVGWPMMMYRAFPNDARLRRALANLLTTPDDEAWREHLRAAFVAYNLDMRIPPLAKDGALERFRRPTLVVGASDDLSFPGARLLARAKQLLPHAETELIEDCKHCPPTNDAFRAWLAGRILEFLGSEPAEAGVAVAAAE